MRNDNDGTENGVVVEWAPFRLAPGADEAALLEASDALQRDFLRQQPGFVRRDLLRAADGQWADLVVWKDEPSAMAAMSAAESSTVCSVYFRLIAGAEGHDVGAGVLHLHRVRAY